MNAERWSEVCRVFDAARELSAPDRAALLDRECGGDADLRAEVESLLARDDGDSFLDEPGPSALPALPARPQVGPYEIVEEIGRGGMGVVYEAVRRDQGFERSVAVKLVKRGMDTDFILRRFESERRILADLDHPNIARVLDGGETSDGLPYFVMELIQGESLLDYCQHRRLDIAGKLALFRQVCSAVTYAHQRLVIHRDIKPANIVVTEEGVPKLLDFGIAKVLSGEDGRSTDRTETALRVLTPEYASPEQVLGRDITTSSDVYSLGVVLYELLTGQRPYRIATGTPEEISAAVLRQDPVRPRTRVRLHRDLDNIVMMALRKEPERRYASAEQLSEDLRRHLEGLPVRATPDSFGYRAGKFVRRHRAGVAAFALGAAAVLVGLGVALVEMREAQRERNRAEAHLSEVRKLATSFVFEHDDAIKDLAGSTPARKLLVERGITYLDRLSREVSGDPAFQRELANAYEKLGKLQGGWGNEGSLGASDGAMQSFRKSLRLREGLASGRKPDPKDRSALAQALISRGSVFQKRGAKAESLADYRRAVAIREAVVAEFPGDVDLKTDLGISYHYLAAGLYESGDYKGWVEALRSEGNLFSEVVRLKPGDRKPRRNLGLAYQYLASALMEDAVDSASPEARRESGETFEKARAIQEALCAEDPGNATYKKDLSSTYSERGTLFDKSERHEDAAESFRRSFEIRETLAAADPKDIIVRRLQTSAQTRLARQLALIGSCDEAVEHARKALTRAEGVAAVDPRNVYYRAELAQTLHDLGFSLRRAAASAPPAERLSRLREGRESLKRSRDAYAALVASGQLPESHRDMVASVAAELEGCDAEISRAKS